MALLAAALLSGMAAGLLLVGESETRVAANYRTSVETFYAADAGLHVALRQLAGTASWTDALSGAATSMFGGGTHQPQLASGQRLDLDAVTHELQAESNSSAVWGADSPAWQLFVWGPLAAAASGATGMQTTCYLAVWIADDGADGDGNPLADSNGRVRLHAEAYASVETRRVVEATVSQAASGVRVLAWREVR
jgi:hypothetical protein